MFLWARFRYPFDTMEWMKKTLENGVVYVPGEAFYHDKPDTRTLRLSYSTVSEAGLLTAVERLAASCNVSAVRRFSAARSLRDVNVQRRVNPFRRSGHRARPASALREKPAQRFQ